MSSPQLARRLSFFTMVLYGVGTILGAGIYVLVGEVAAESGYYTPHAFLLAAVIVSISAHAYARLSRRFPVSAGEAVYVYEAFHRQWLATAVGWSIIFTGIVSSATIARGFTGYMEPYLAIHPAWLIIVLVGLLSAVAIWGVAQAVGLAALFTLVELAGIGIVIFLAAPNLIDFISVQPELRRLPPVETWASISFGAFLAFYAYIGFEDMVNMAEEVKQPERNLPKAIYWALAITGILYGLTALSLMSLIPMTEFAGNNAPFSTVAAAHPALSIHLMSVISVAAITNGALLQLVMGSRVLYGMAIKGLAPGIFSRVSGKTQTPIIATLVVAAAALLFALALPVASLARITSSIILMIFSLVNASLLILEWRAGNRRLRAIAPPTLGLLLCLSFLLVQLLSIYE